MKPVPSSSPIHSHVGVDDGMVGGLSSDMWGRFADLERGAALLDGSFFHDSVEGFRWPVRCLLGEQSFSAVNQRLKAVPGKLVVPRGFLDEALRPIEGGKVLLNKALVGRE